MKTTIKSFIIICTLGVVGILNANATTNCELKDSKLTSANQVFAGLNEKMTSFASEIDESVDYQKEAQLVTKWIADRAEAKATQQIIERNPSLVDEMTTFSENEFAGESNNAITDFRKEAQLVTKAIADREEAMAIQKLVTENRIAENR